MRCIVRLRVQKFTTVFGSHDIMSLDIYTQNAQYLEHRTITDRYYFYVHTVRFYCLLLICTNKCTHTHTIYIYIYIYIYTHIYVRILNYITNAPLYLFIYIYIYIFACWACKFLKFLCCILYFYFIFLFLCLFISIIFIFYICNII